MRVAVATEDAQTVSAHFGMARHYLVYDVEGKAVKMVGVRDKAGHLPMKDAHHAMGSAEEDGLHSSMLSSADDCDVIIAGGMGRPMYAAILASGKKAYVTMIRSADEAVRALADGSLVDHPELLHGR